MAEPTPVLYSRLVVSFAHDVAPSAADAVIELARALGAEVQALLLEDSASLALADLPASRTFDTQGAAWRALERSELQHQLALTEAVLRRRLLRAAETIGVPAQFNVVRGAPTAALDQWARAGDLLVITAPTDRMARWVQPFAGLIDAALASPATVLVLPQRLRARHGGVAALATPGAPKAGELAAQLAQALDAPLQSLPPAGDIASLLPQLVAQRAHVLVCGRDALAPDPHRTLQAASDAGIAVLIAAAEGAAAD